MYPVKHIIYNKDLVTNEEIFEVISTAAERYSKTGYIVVCTNENRNELLTIVSRIDVVLTISVDNIFFIY